MSQPLPIPPKGFDGLSIEEQIEYIEALWNYVASREEYTKIPEWHREILEERMTRYNSDNGDGKTWEEFEQELTKG